MTYEEELEAELGFVRSQIDSVREQAPFDTPSGYDTLRFMWVSRAKALEAKLATLHNGEQGET